MIEPNDIIEILLIEDNPQDIELTTRSLKKHNLANNMYVVKDGEEALEFLFAKGKYKDRNENNLPKVILLDLKLPKVSGLDVLKKIKNDEQMKTVPIVVMTSSQEESDIVETYKLGVNSYIVKPVDFDKFSKSIVDIGYYWLLLNKSLI